MKSTAITALFLSLFFPLASAADAGEYLQFSPRSSEERAYQLYTHGIISAEGRAGRQTLEQEARMMLRYRVLERTPHLRLNLQPEYLSMDVGRTGFSSAAEAEGRIGDLQSLLSGGFEVEMDTATGDVLDFRLGNDAAWRRLTESDSAAEMLLQQLRNQMTQPGQPGLGVRVPLRERAELTVPGAEGTPDLRLRVERVTQDEVHLALRGGDDEARMAGFMVLEREGGWLRRLGAVVDVPFEASGVRGTLRQRVAMAPADWRGALPMASSLYGEDQQFRPMSWFPEEAQAASKRATRDEVFPSAVGEFLFEGHGIPARLDAETYAIELRLGHRLREPLALGRLRFAEVELRDADGDVVDIAVHVGRPWEFRPWDHAHVRSTALVLPLQWGVESELARVAEIRALAHYQPSTLREVEIALDPDRSVRTDDGDAWVTATPLAQDGVFEFRFGGNADHRILWAFAPELGARGRLVSDPDAELPDWLEPEDMQFLGRMRNDGAMPALQVQLDEVPERLRFYAYEVADAPVWTQPVRFLTPRRRHADLDLPPMAQLGLRPEEHRADARPDDGSPVAVATAELQPSGEAQHRLELTLSDVQAALCTLSVENGAQLQGTPLEWQPEREDASRRFLRPQHLPVAERWRLRTADGVRSHFYDLEVVTRLQCAGEGRWREADYALGGRPWLIDLPALLGEAPDPAMPARDLLGRYRFLDETGEALSLQPAEAYAMPSLDEASLGDYLLQGRYLRIAGVPARVEALEAAGEAVDRRWTTRFPPLP
ncbi:hypothetical protein H0E84_04230 [Luteimonas sp. SJ-92]|uniref:Uncharacterized protein n=1 Tax=Luteimonas salinisoli TaxID=2752307 RepID=A0A853JAC6_9GAMM|nr:hypothetical protein [Luteimonas salinisoli]NZA25580.1 hypothetical protein [Luteimonas salinisoli]